MIYRASPEENDSFNSKEISNDDENVKTYEKSNRHNKFENSDMNDDENEDEEENQVNQSKPRAKELPKNSEK